MSKLGEEVNSLIKEIKKGKWHAFEKLHDLTYNHLTVIAYNYLYDSSDIEDVINNSYFRIYQYINSADADKDVYNWMCKIVQNIAYQYNKKHNVTVDINKAETQNLFYELDDSIIETTDIMRAVKALNREEQELIYLKYWEDLSFSEIATLKGAKKPTVYKRISVALKKVKEILEIR